MRLELHTQSDPVFKFGDPVWQDQPIPDGCVLLPHMNWTTGSWTTFDMSDKVIKFEMSKGKSTYRTPHMTHNAAVEDLIIVPERSGKVV